MNFKDIKTGYSVFVLDKTNIELTTEKVIGVSLPHIDSKIASTNMVVDISTDSNTYCAPADTDIAYPLNKVITTDKQNILREVESLKTTSEQRLANINHDEEIVSKCKQLIADIDPIQKEKQATEARFNNIEKSMKEMMQMLKKMAE